MKYITVAYIIQLSFYFTYIVSLENKCEAKA